MGGNRKGKKNKFQKPHNLKDLYQNYISDKEQGSIYYVDRKMFRSVLEDYISFINKGILDSSIFFMPYGMGSTYVVKRIIYPGHGMQVDWEITNRIGKKVYHLNEHSNGYKYHFKWDKQPMRFRNHKIYRLAMNRMMKRALAKCIKVEGKDYIADK